MRASRWIVALPFVATGCLFFSPTDFIRRPDLSGSVTIDGVPVPGVSVTAQTNSFSQTVTTGASGAFAFNQVPFGAVTVSASALPPMVVLQQSSHVVTLGNGEVQVHFKGFSPAPISGRVLWEYRTDNFKGFPGVSARIDQPPYPLGAETSDADGAYRIVSAPGYGDYDVVLGPPQGVRILGGNRWSFRAPTLIRGVDTSYVSYDPAAQLSVNVYVDGVYYPNVLVDLSTPLPVSGPPDLYKDLPVMPLQVRISGFSSQISFDATAKTVQLSAGSNSVTFTGYTPTGNRPPVPSILSPANNATYFLGAPITLQGFATDYEDGDLTGAALDWYTPGRGSYGHGHTVTIDTLPVGQHRIVLRATDRQGSTAVSFVDINVVAASGGRVSGNVMIDNGPGFQVRVDLSTTPVRSANTDLAGNYSFANVPAGNYTVTVQPVTCVEFPVSSRAIAVASGATTVANFTGFPVAGCYDYGYGGGGYKTKPPARPPH